MPELSFHVESAESLPLAAVPTLAFKLCIENADPDEVIHSVVLRAQIQIETTRRRYSATEKADLRDLFGEPDRWSRTLRPMLWTHASVMVQRFSGRTSVDLHVP